MPLTIEHLPAILDALPDPLFVLSESGWYLGVYGGTDTDYYHDGSHLVGCHLDDMLPAEKAAEVLRQIATSLREQRMLKVEYQLAAAEVDGLEDADGPAEAIWFEGHIQPLPVSIDGERAVIWIARNISARKQLEDRLREASLVDPLTGTFNRRKLMHDLDQHFQELQRYGHPCALLMLDIDHFKQVNDQFGHAVGDEALRSMVGVCKNHLRVNDLLARFGGEEFVVLLPNTRMEEARETAERLRSQVAGAVGLGAGKPVTISVGVAQMNAADASFEAAIKRADDALYQAKRSGRNRVVSG